MSLKVYSIIWADDECDTLAKDKSIRRFLDMKHIEVLSFVRTSKELKHKLEFFSDKVDAVVVDGNFSKEDKDYLEADDISGLVHTVSFIGQFNVKRDIPFFLYTAKKVMLEDFCHNGEIDYFTDSARPRFFQKGNIEELFNEIINTVEFIHSVEFMVKKNYRSLLDLAGKVSASCEENLYQFLLDEARDTKFDKSRDMFTSLRQMLEEVQTGCKDIGLIPKKINTLNHFKFYWTNEKMGCKIAFSNEEYHAMPTSGIMPKVVCHTLDKLIDVLQDGSHKTNNLNLHVSEYVTNVHSPFLFRGCMYLVMDVIRWFVDTADKKLSGEMKSDNGFYKEWTVPCASQKNKPTLQIKSTN